MKALKIENITIPYQIKGNITKVGTEKGYPGKKLTVILFLEPISRERMTGNIKRFIIS